jgi:hypothetical protein
MMKRFFILAAVAILCLAAFAQTSSDSIYIAQRDSLQNILDLQQRNAREKSIWGKGRYTNLGYAITDFAADDESPTRSQWSFFFTKGTAFNFPRHALGGVVKFAIDARWIDLQASKLKNFDQKEWTSEIDYSAMENGESDIPNIGKYVITAGMGIGPRITVAPLSSLKGFGKYLKLSLYFHYRPSYTLYVASESGDTEVSSGFFNMFDFGGCINYHAVSLGVEGNWGNGKMKAFNFDDDFVTTSEKIKHKIASTRFYISFVF